MYTFQMSDDDDCGIKLEDGRHVVFLSANLYDEVESEDLRSLLKYVNDGEANTGSKLVSMLHNAVAEANEDEECMMYMSAADEIRYYQEVINQQKEEIEANKAEIEANKAEIEADRVRLELASLLISANRGNEFVEAQSNHELMGKLLAEFDLGPKPGQRG